MVAHIVTPKVAAKLECMSPTTPGKVVNELVLGNVAALREAPHLIQFSPRDGSSKARCKHVVRESTIRKFVILGELRHIVTTRCREHVGLGGAKGMGFVQLHVPLRLIR